MSSLNQDLLKQYISKLKLNKPILSNLEDEDIYSLMNIQKNDEISLYSLLLFGSYPQVFSLIYVLPPL